MATTIVGLTLAASFTPQEVQRWSSAPRLAATSVAAIPLLALVAAPAALLAVDPPVTLRFAIADEMGRLSDPYVRAFVQEVALRSGGSVTLDPTWDAGGDDYEQGVVRMLVDGTADVALAAGRPGTSPGSPASRRSRHRSSSTATSWRRRSRPTRS